MGELRGQGSSLVRCLIAAREREREKEPRCSILHVSGKYAQTLKGPVGSLVSITQETQILFQCMLKLVFEGESTTLTNAPHESCTAESGALSKAASQTIYMDAVYVMLPKNKIKQNKKSSDKSP